MRKNSIFFSLLALTAVALHESPASADCRCVCIIPPDFHYHLRTADSVEVCKKDCELQGYRYAHCADIRYFQPDEESAERKNPEYPYNHPDQY